jgi:hypothetical protein
MTAVRKRRRRFARSKATRDVWITDRVLSILRALARFRFLTINQIITLLDIEQRVYALPPVSRQKVSRLLRDLYDGHYIERVLGPVTNLTEFSAVHRMPTTYALAQQGARQLSSTDGTPLDHIDWQLKNRRVGSLHIDHTIGVADFVIAFLAASKEYGLELIDHHDLIPYLPPTARDVKALTLSVSVDGVEYTRRPDRLLALSGWSGGRLYFVHEWHSGEMPNRRDPAALWRGHRQSNFADKIWIYWKARLAGAFRAIWGATNVRVLTVTASDESIVNLSRQVARITERPLTKLFLFTTPARLFGEGPLAPIWYAPHHALDGATNHYTLKALRHAMPISVLDGGEPIDGPIDQRRPPR